MIERSANQLWRESNTTLSFKDWLNREKAKFINFNGDIKSDIVMVNKPLNDTIQTTIEGIRKSVGYQKEAKGKTILGINQTYFIIGGVLIVGFIAYKIIKSKK